jgi:hypothetical protein
MPAYAKDGKVVCFFQSAQKFKTRYATLGFGDAANLDEGAMWPTVGLLGRLLDDLRLQPVEGTVEVGRGWRPAGTRGSTCRAGPRGRP